MEGILGKIGLHWFRRDLRLVGNQALIHNLNATEGRTLALFCFDSKFLKREDFSHNRFAFFIETLKELQKEIRKNGGDLLVLDEAPLKAFERIHDAPKKNGDELSLVTWSRDYEPFSKQRDSKVYSFLKDHGTEVVTKRDHLIIEPHELKKSDGGFYQVFTPFMKRWLELSRTAEVQKRLSHAFNFEKPPQFKVKSSKILPSFYQEAILEEFETKNSKKVSIEIPEAGHVEALSRAKSFQAKIDNYKNDRDIPSIPGTSRLSHFFKNGSLTTAQAISLLGPLGPTSTYLKEIIWREFYIHILNHRPEVETSAFNEKYADLKWQNDEKLFEAWKQGRTGYPIVDAGMNELNTTGFMHNRVRMIVASFLTKDLLIDWRWGENYFMQKLIDGDLAANNGGWQWAASTGCDPQPYFRIFNPELQAKRFDPNGEYIQKYAPIPCKPIVIHAEQKIKALKLFKS